MAWNLEQIHSSHSPVARQVCALSRSLFSPVKWELGHILLLLFCFFQVLENELLHVAQRNRLDELGVVAHTSILEVVVGASRVQGQQGLRGLKNKKQRNRLDGTVLFQ